jgi:hypothetical protein
MVSAVAEPQFGQVIVDSKILSATSRIQIAKCRQYGTEREDAHQ